SVEDSVSQHQIVPAPLHARMDIFPVVGTPRSPKHSIASAGYVMARAGADTSHPGASGAGNRVFGARPPSPCRRTPSPHRGPATCWVGEISRKRPVDKRNG